VVGNKLVNECTIEAVMRDFMRKTTAHEKRRNHTSQAVLQRCLGWNDICTESWGREKATVTIHRREQPRDIS
jgi:hypothetical protein